MKHLKWKELVPVTKHDAVVKALEHAFGTTKIDAVEPLRAGRSSALVYKITVHEKSYVMRLVTQVDALRDPNRQFACMNAAARARIAPPVHYTNAHDAISIVDYVEHTPLRAGFASEKEMFCEMATCIKSIHALPLFPKLVNFLDGVEDLIKGFQISKLLPDTATEEHFRYYAEIQRAYPRDEANLVSSHNDLNPTNVLHSGSKIWVIDWEAAFANDCYVDLAIVNIFFGSGERGEEALLDTYFGTSLGDYHRARFFLMQQVCFMYVSMLFMNLVSNSSQPREFFDSAMKTISLKEFHAGLRSGEILMVSVEEHLLYAKAMLNESLSQMKAARFEKALSIVRTKQNEI